MFGEGPVLASWTAPFILSTERSCRNCCCCMSPEDDEFGASVAASGTDDAPVDKDDIVAWTEKTIYSAQTGKFLAHSPTPLSNSLSWKHSKTTKVERRWDYYWKCASRTPTKPIQGQFLVATNPKTLQRNCVISPGPFLQLNL